MAHFQGTFNESRCRVHQSSPANRRLNIDFALSKFRYFVFNNGVTLVSVPYFASINGLTALQMKVKFAAVVNSALDYLLPTLHVLMLPIQSG
jgi:hypothetical protein